MNDDAGFREVFRGDLPAVEMAKGVLDEIGVSSHWTWEQAGGLRFGTADAAFVPGRTAVLLVPSVAYDEAAEALAGFNDPEPDITNELSGAVEDNRKARRGIAAFILMLLFAPLAIAIVLTIIELLRGFFS